RHYSLARHSRAIGTSRTTRSASSSATSCSAGHWAPSRRAVSRPPSERSETWSPPPPFTCSGSSPSRGSRTCSQSDDEFEIPAPLPRRRSRSSESSEERLGDRQEPGDDTNRDAEDRGQDAEEQREFLPPQVHEQEEQEREEPGSGSDEDDDPTKADAVLPDQIGAEHDGEASERSDADEDVGQHDQERGVSEHLLEEGEEPVDRADSGVAAHEEQDPGDAGEQGRLGIGAHGLTALGGSSA